MFENDQKLYIKLNNVATPILDSSAVNNPANSA